MSALPATPVVRDWEWPKTKKEAEAFARDVILSQPIRQPFDTRAHAIALDMLSFHWRAIEKIGPGVSHFYRTDNKLNKTAFVLMLVRTDGTEDDLSYLKCLAGRYTKVPAAQKAQRQNAYAALRKAIYPQIAAFRSQTLAATLLEGKSPQCAVTGVSLSEGNLVVDHQHPKTFHTLAHSYLSDRNLSIDDVATLPDTVEVGRILADPKLLLDWQAYHATHAHLRLIDKSLNMSLGGRATPGPLFAHLPQDLFTRDGLQGR